MFQLIMIVFGCGAMGFVYFKFCKEASKQLLKTMSYSINVDKEGGDGLNRQEGCMTYYAEEDCFNMDNNEEKINRSMRTKTKINSMC